MKLLALLQLVLTLADTTPLTPAGQTPFSGTSLHRTPLFGSIHEYAYYFADLLVGTPPQVQSVIVDSGSSMLAFSCNSCPKCGRHIDVPFQVEKSSSSEWINCSDPRCLSDNCAKADGIDHCAYSQSYSEGSSLYGYYLSDFIGFKSADGTGSVHMLRFDHVGCHSRETNLFTTQKASGILGIAPSNAGIQASALEALFNDPELHKRVVALCLAEEGGLMTIGDYDTSLHSDPTVTWTKIASKQSYQVDVQSVAVAGEILAGRPSRSIIDSGTTFSYLPSALYSAVFHHLSNKCSSIRDCSIGTTLSRMCWSTNSKTYEDALEQLDTLFPSITLRFRDGATYEWRPASYFYSKASPKRWCVGIDRSYGSETVLGMTFMKNNNVIFDRQTFQLGFARAQCPTHKVKQRTVSLRQRADHVQAAPLLALAVVGETPCDHYNLNSSVVLMGLTTTAVACILVMRRRSCRNEPTDDIRTALNRNGSLLAQQ